jgi:hypothetical protein
MAAGRGDAEAVYASAAAAQATVARSRVAALLGRRGITVVEGVPDDLPPRLADHYLALKTAGRL